MSDEPKVTLGWRPTMTMRRDEDGRYIWERDGVQFSSSEPIETMRVEMPINRSMPEPGQSYMAFIYGPITDEVRAYYAEHWPHVTKLVEAQPGEAVKFGADGEISLVPAGEGEGDDD